MLRGCKDNNLRFLWVDTIIPEADWLLWNDIVPRTDPPRSDDPSIWAIALVYGGSGSGSEKYWITMSLGPTATEAFRRRDIDALIPEDSTDWLSVDRTLKAITIQIR